MFRWHGDVVAAASPTATDACAPSAAPAVLRHMNTVVLVAAPAVVVFGAAVGRDASYGAAWNNWGFVREAAGDLEGAEQVTAQSPPTAAPPLLLLLRPAITVFATGTNASTTEPLAIKPLVAHPRSLLANFFVFFL